MALATQGWRLLVRAVCAARIYGWAFAAGVPLRTVWANWINAIATMLAILSYVRTRLSRRTLVWWKTEHTYPAFEPGAVAPVVACEEIDPETVCIRAARSLSRQFVERWRVFPARVSEGTLLLATPDTPSSALLAEIRKHTRLEVCFQKVPPENFERLAAELL
jgi:hypothetical protein